MKRLFPRGPIVEVGSGHRPYPQSDVLVDLHVEDDTEREGELRTDNRPLVVANLESLPFRDGAFGYSIASHVLEHMDDISSALSELQRVSPAGYIETPSALLEFIQPHKSYHLWFVKWENNRLTLIRKENRKYIRHSVMARLFSENFGFRLCLAANVHLLISKIYWKEGIEFRIEEREFHPDEYLPLVRQGMRQFAFAFLETIYEVASRKVAALLYRFYRMRKIRMEDLLVCSRCRSNITILSNRVTCSNCQGYFPVKSKIYYMLQEHFVPFGSGQHDTTTSRM